MSGEDSKPGGRGLSEINMTPLIDVSLVLVVMLLLATPLAFESTIGVRREAAAAQSAASEIPHERVELHLLSEHTVLVNRMPVDLSDVEMALRPLLLEGSRLVVISSEGAVTHGTFVDVLDQARISGAEEIAVTGR